MDASLNNYVAQHYASRHELAPLHVGHWSLLGPYIMGDILTGGQSWNMGYRCISIIQMVLTAILIFSLPLWQKRRRWRRKSRSGRRQATSFPAGNYKKYQELKRLWLPFSAIAQLSRRRICGLAVTLFYIMDYLHKQRQALQACFLSGLLSADF